MIRAIMYPSSPQQPQVSQFMFASKSLTVVFVAASVAVAAVGMAGCTGGETPAKPVGSSSPDPVPAPELAKFLHDNYRVVADLQAPLEAGHPADVIVVSTGPGTVPNQPLQGGTEDVQVLTYDTIAKRWTVAFDAAEKMIDSSMAPRAVTPGPQALLPQDRKMGNVVARPVQFVAGTADLLVYGVDRTANHPSGVLAVLGFDNGNPRVAYYDSEVNMSPPTIAGPAGGQRVTITGDFGTSIDPACCPVRKFTQVIASTGNTHAAPPALGVVEDDRPWLGAWYVTLRQQPEPGPAIVAGLVDRSPASAVLRVGDRLLGVADTALPPGDTYQPAVVDQVAVHRPGDRVVLQVQRNGQNIDVPVMLAAHNSPAYRDDSLAPKQGVLGVQPADAPAGMPSGALVTDVSSGSPAAQAGLRVGDDIMTAGQVTVRSADDLRLALMGQALTTIALVVRHADGTTMTVPVTPVAVPAGGTPTLTAAGI